MKAGCSGRRFIDREKKRRKRVHEGEQKRVIERLEKGRVSACEYMARKKVEYERK